MIRRPSPAISSAAGNSFVSSDLAKKIRLGLAELATVREQLTPLMRLPETSAGVIERAAACAMLHSFYTEIEKILRLITREWDGQMSSSEAWHRELLNQMSVATAARPAVLSGALVEALGEFLRRQVPGTTGQNPISGQSCDSSRAASKPPANPL